MADFTDRLPLTDGTNRIIDDPAGPSIVTPILKTLSGGLESYVNYREGVMADREKAKKEAEKAREGAAQSGVIGALYGAQDDVVAAASGRAAAQQAVSALDQDLRPLDSFSMEEMTVDEKTGAVFGTGNQMTINPVVEKRTGQAIGDITNFMAAVDQGRMPAISLKAAINGRLRKLFEEYPDQAENILDMINKTEAKDVVFAEIGDLVSEINGQRTSAQNEREDQRKFRQALKEAGAKGVGELALTGGPNGGPMSDDALVGAGLRYARQEAELSMTKTQLDIAKTRRDLSDAERADIEKTGQKDIVRIISGNFYNQAMPLLDVTGQLAASLAADPLGKFAAQWEELGVWAANKSHQLVEASVALAVENGYTGDHNTLRSNFKATLQGVLDNFAGDKGVAAANHRALATMKDKMGITQERAFPVFMSLKAAGLKPEEMTGFMEGLQRNSNLQKALRDEIEGAIPEFGEERASTRLMNIIKIMRGDATLANRPASEAREALPVLYGTALEVAKGYRRGLGVNPDTVMNSVGEIAIATRTLSPSSGAAANAFAAAGLNDGNVVAALIKMNKDPNLDQAQVNATIQAARAGSAVVLNNMSLNLGKINQQYGQYYQVKWDNSNGRYILDDSKKKAAIAQAQKGSSVRMTGEDARFARMGGGLAEANIRGASVPKEMERWLKAANLSLDGIVKLAPHDESAPKENELALRRFYARGVPLKSMQANGDAAIRPDKEIQGMFDKVRKGFDSIQPSAVEVDGPTGGSGPGARSVTGVRGQTVTVPAVEEITTKFGSNPNLGLVQSTAQAKGIPVELATRLAFVENKFNHGNTNSAGASGVMQVRGFNPKTGEAVHDTESVKRFGKRVKDLSAAENIELGMDILRRNFEKTGSWKKAVERYLGNGNDGNLTTGQYAELII